MSAVASANDRITIVVLGICVCRSTLLSGNCHRHRRISQARLFVLGMIAMNKNPIARTLIEMSGQANVITVFRSFVDFTESLEAGMLLSQLLYWTPRARDGWIAKSDKDFMDELCLSRYAIRQARAVLVKKKILEIDIRKFAGAPTVHYKLNLEKLEELWIVRFQTMDCANPDNGLSESVQSLTEITTEITTETLARDEKQPKERSNPISLSEGENVTTADELKKRTEEALFSNIASQGLNGGLDLSKYPEDVRPVLLELNRLWGISPPAFKGNASKNSRAADWISGARELLVVCEEFGLPALERYYKEWHAGMVENKRKTGIGTAPHAVSRPGSLINPIAGKVGEWRVQSREPSQVNDLPPEFAHLDKGRAWINSELYIDGKKAVKT